MFDVYSLSDEEFDALGNKALDMFQVVAEQGLSQNDPDLYSKVFKLSTDEDYVLTVGLRQVADNDEYDAQLSSENIICAEFTFVAEEGTLKNDIHVLDLFFDPTDDAEDKTVSASWFPED